jgi:hypothetical protein
MIGEGKLAVRTIGLETGKSGKLRTLAPATVNEAYPNRGHSAAMFAESASIRATRGHFAV